MKGKLRNTEQKYERDRRKEERRRRTTKEMKPPHDSTDFY
jgi:hypothetical protein